LRSFIAIELPERVKAALLELQQELKKEENKGIKGPIGRLFKSKADVYSAQEAMMEDQIRMLRDSGGTEAANRLEVLRMEIPKVNILYGDEE